MSLDHNQLISTKGLRDVYTLLHLNCSHNHLASVEGLENSALLNTLDLRANSLTEVKQKTKQKTVWKLIWMFGEGEVVVPPQVVLNSPKIITFSSCRDVNNSAFLPFLFSLLKQNMKTYLFIFS